MLTTLEATLQNVLEKAVDNKKIYGTSFAVRYRDFYWSSVAGNISIHQPYFIASTTKLFTTAIILQLLAENKLQLEDPIHQYIDSAILDGLHVYKGTDYSQSLTILHLLAHTSGLADYFQNKDSSGMSLEKDLMNGNDQYWTFEEAIEKTKAMQPFFAPGTKGKAHYSDTNFQLLGKIIEAITKTSYNDNCIQRIIQPLNLPSTHLYTDPNDPTPKPLYFKDHELHIPKAMTSFGPDGGMVSTSEDMRTFIHAFFTGVLFPSEYIPGLHVWNRIFFPLQAGVGIHRFVLPRIFDPLRKTPELIGHSGLSGALAYCSPVHDLYIAGTVNQVAHPDASFRVMIQLVQTLLKQPMK